MNPTDLQFFVTQSISYPILAATEKEGMHFTIYGESYSNNPQESHGMHYYRKTEILSGMAKISLSEALRQFRGNGKQNFLKKLNLTNPDIKITEEITQQIISKLKQSRAFNEDSAMEMNESEICFVLSTQGLIKEYSGRFFIEKDLKNIKDFRDIPLTQAILNV